MLKSKLIIVSSSYDETITSCILNNRTSIDFDMKVLVLDELLTTYEINDEINDDETIIRWISQKGDIISNKDYMLLSRVTHVSESLFEKFICKDRMYAKNEFEAYLGFALNAFEGVGNKSYNGLCVKICSLPDQWNKVKDIVNLNVPYFYWGPQQFNILNSDEMVIYSEIGNFLNWRHSYNSPAREHVFCFKKPTGRPVFIFNIGSKILLDLMQDINQKMRDRLEGLTAIIREKFDYFVFEILFFIDEDKITFGCINHNICWSNKTRGFEKFVCDNLIREYVKCLE